MPRNGGLPYEGRKPVKQEAEEVRSEPQGTQHATERLLRHFFLCDVELYSLSLNLSESIHSFESHPEKRGDDAPPPRSPGVSAYRRFSSQA